MSLTAINPVSDLRDYNKVLKKCKDGEPVILTKNGRGLYVVMTIDEYEELSLLHAIRDKAVRTPPNQSIAR